MIEKPDNLDNRQEQPAIAGTTDFMLAVEEGRLEEAERWLAEQSKNPTKEGYDARWLDHRQRELFRAYNAKKDWVSAKKIVEATADASSKDGRVRRLEELSGREYSAI